MAAPDARAAPHKYIVVKKFKTLNSQPKRNALKPEEFSWIENLMPIGNSFLPAIPAPGSALAVLDGRTRTTTISATTASESWSAASTASVGVVSGLTNHALLFHFDSDLKDTSGTISWNVSTLDTTVSKFGAGSMKVTSSSGSLSPAYSFGQWWNGSWTMQCFMRTNNFQNLSITLDTNELEIDYNSAGNFISWHLDANALVNRTATTSITADAFMHVAVVRNTTSGIYGLYHNGARIDSVTSTANISNINLGAVAVASQPSNTWIDEFAFSGAAEYSGTSYTVPTAAFTI